MKQIIRKIMLAGLLCCGLSGTGFGQSQEVQQLLLNIEKLAQLKSILSQMKQGFSVISQGYERIRTLSKGSFNLHEVFLDGLLQVSPTVRQYWKVGQIFTTQQSILRECNRLRGIVQASGAFSPGEAQYLSGVQQNLLTVSGKQLEELAMVLTSSRLRMSDAERLQAIDRIAETAEGQLTFIHRFNSSGQFLKINRQREQADIDATKKLHGINH